MADPGGDVEDAFLNLPFLSLDFPNLHVCMGLEKDFCLKNYNSKKLMSKKSYHL